VPAELQRMRDDRELVYSSDGGTSKVSKRRAPPAQATRVPNDGIVRIARERRRAGIVSVVSGLDARELAEVAGALKKLCGSGGTAKNGLVEIQGDHREKIATWFCARGRRAKVAGG
jgi:translation initiation factor 1